MDWKKELKENITTAKEIKKALNWNLNEEQTKKLEDIIELYPMSVPKYYLSLINPNDDNDPIKKLCIPSINETDISGSFDTSGEAANTVVTGLQHKYKQTALLLSTNRCAMYCRHCFRKRLVGSNDAEINKHFDEIIDYINDHEEITNVLISGGDAFINSNTKIKHYLNEFSKIDHLDFIRFGTRTPVVFPMRIYGDDELLDILEKYSKKKKIYVITHFNHPNELTSESKKAIDALLYRGIVVRNQTVLLKGINDNADTLADLMSGLTRIGITPYYVFQCRPVSSVKKEFQVPLKIGFEITKDAKAKLDGIAKNFRYVMSHETGKIEILGNLTEGKMIFKYHQAKYEKDYGRIFELDIKDDAAWLGNI